MSSKNRELVVPDGASMAMAGELFGLLWGGVKEGLDAEISGINPELHPDSFREANVAKTKVIGWKELSQRMVLDPKSLTLNNL